MLSFLKHVHDCQRSIDCKEELESKACRSAVSAQAWSATGSGTQLSSPQKPTKHRPRKEEAHEHRHRRPRIVIPREIRVYHDSMEPVSPLRNPRTKLAVSPQKRERVPNTALIEIDDSKADMSVGESATLVSELMSQTEDWNEERKNERRPLTPQCSSVSSRTSTLLDDLEIRSKDTMRSRPCYSEIKGHVAPVTPQQSPVRRFSVDNGQIAAGNLAVLDLLGEATVAGSTTSGGALETARDNDDLAQSICSSKVPRQRAQSLLPNLQTPIRGPQVAKVAQSPLSPTKRCSLTSQNLLQSLKATYSPRTPVRGRVVASSSTDTTRPSERKHALERDGSYSNIASPRKSPRRTESKGCLPALSPRLASPTKTTHHNNDILLPYSACDAGQSFLDAQDTEVAQHKPKPGTRRRSLIQTNTNSTVDSGCLVSPVKQRGSRCASVTPTMARETFANSENRQRINGSRRSSMSQVTGSSQQNPNKQRSSRRSSMSNVKQSRRSSLSHSRDSSRTRRDHIPGNRGKQNERGRSNTRSQSNRRQRRRSSAVQPKESAGAREDRPRRSLLPNESTRRRSSMGQVNEGCRYRARADRGGRNIRRQTMSHISPQPEHSITPDKEQVQRYIANELGKLQRNISDSLIHGGQRRRTLTHVESGQDGKAELQAYIARQLGDNNELNGVVRSSSKRSSSSGSHESDSKSDSQAPPFDAKAA